tara:strand:- start:311 stop:970 length:660 start_codon:yes stop_codon:yes gene_type:complete
MKNRFIIALILLLLLSTYKIQDNLKIDVKTKIEKIIIENNFIIEEKTIRENLSFLYKKNLLNLNKTEIKTKLNKIEFVESFEVKKIYPNKIKIKIYEKKPVAIIQNKKQKRYFTEKGDVINFFYLKKFENLPLVFGDKDNFKIFYNNLRVSNFPMKEIKTFYLFESNRWDLELINNKMLRLPINNYNQSLKNFIEIKDQLNFEKYKTFDYRIKDQLILK